LLKVIWKAEFKDEGNISEGVDYAFLFLFFFLMKEKKTLWCAVLCFTRRFLSHILQIIRTTFSG